MYVRHSAAAPPHDADDDRGLSLNRPASTQAVYPPSSNAPDTLSLSRRHRASTPADRPPSRGDRSGDWLPPPPAGRQLYTELVNGWSARYIGHPISIARPASVSAMTHAALVTLPRRLTAPISAAAYKNYSQSWTSWNFGRPREISVVNVCLS